MIGRRIIALGAVAGAMLLSVAAQAQTYPPPPPPGGGYAPPPPGYAPPPAAPQQTGVQRDSLYFGVGLGLGNMSPDCDGCDSLGGLALELHLGLMLSPRFGLLLDGSGISHLYDDGTQLIQAVDTVAAQYWVNDQVWLKGGLGIGQISLTDENGDTQLQSETGSAFLLGIGYEVVQGRHFTVDLQARVAATHYTEGEDLTLTNVSALAAVNWY